LSLSTRRFGRSSYEAHWITGLVSLLIEVPCEVLHERERHTLTVVGDRLTFRPPRRRDAVAQVVEFLIGELDPVGPDLPISNRRHVSLLEL
jgi:hypothetical protein